MNFGEPSGDASDRNNDNNNNNNIFTLQSSNGNFASANPINVGLGGGGGVGVGISLSSNINNINEQASSSSNSSSSSSQSLLPLPLTTHTLDLKHRLSVIAGINANAIGGSNSNIVKPSLQKLKYDIHAWSSHSANYHPRHILVNKPTDQGSRWSSGSNNQMQFVTIKLDRVAVVHTITFGKYHKSHVCNLKGFKVYGGLSPSNMIELLHSGLRNDSEPETFSLKHKINDITFPCQYIKIAPQVAWGPHFNFSIWYLEFRGIQEPSFVERAYLEYTNYRESEVVRLCLKHFRQRNYMDVFQSLQERSQLQLEDPLLTELHRQLVIQGDFSMGEQLIHQAHERNLFQEYVSDCNYRPVWNRVLHGGDESPCMRGGHQMCIDPDTGHIYLFGGWDGQRDLADFWQFDQTSRKWTCISPDTKKMGGPGPRSCHKVCFDPLSKMIFTMGRYVDPDHRPNVNLDGDFWKFDTVTGTWFKISSNTAADGGPELIYDHQMVIDSERQMMYIFGGRTIGPDPNQIIYSGLYSYSIPHNEWRLLRSDSNHQENFIQLHSRIGHSMLLNPKTRELYIFAGQRNKDYLSDFYVYDIDTDTVHEISRDYSKQGGPDAGFTQRATIDPDLNEFYVLSGLQKDKNTSQESVKNSFWCYNLRKARWSRVYHNENTMPEYWAQMKGREPCPRFAHQLVYDPVRRIQFLFGGNPGDPTNLNLRLDDFWELHLLRPKTTDILRRVKFLIKRQQFREMCDRENPIVALQFLQSEVSAVVDHADEKESKEFRELAQCLFHWPGKDGSQRPPVFGLQGGAVVGGDGFGRVHGASDVGSSSGGSSRNIGGSMGGVESNGGVSAMGGLASGGMAVGQDVDDQKSVNDPYAARTALYESLLEYFPVGMREPKGNLVDLIDLVPMS
ncbi:Muskelin 1, intracellular mediator containing kelch motif [Blyttiomyces sp. JEL0837]|nr:Muskelin 1, intracellular mediator containing kelch motif [Blyttiomyces sp. JEL0837]